jgi:hypothetical protein
MDGTFLRIIISLGSFLHVVFVGIQVGVRVESNF